MNRRRHWRKLGRIFEGAEIGDWSAGYAAIPLAEPLGGEHYRIHFSARDRKNRSRPGWLIFDMERFKVEEAGQAPSLELGELGTFDDSGVMPTWLVSHSGRDYLYYVGWNRGVTVPFRNSIGLAVRDSPGESFKRAYLGPIMDRTRSEPHFCASCCVLIENGLWRNWYLSCIGWREMGDGPAHYYHIKYAESDNGIDWNRDGHIAIDLAGEHEHAISRPSVLRQGGGYRMWFSARGPYYRIYEADSPDGIEWTRAPKPALDRSETGWDSKMVECPFVFEHRSQRFMLYNGNDYGRSGIGLAVLEDDY